ncbi:acyl-CoA dehydrogenase family protein [Polymorphobacter sp.]|uniref:acyl-CoA dehydrogenase family protein n=1 Tax=Polymorphobacter sp. TaxID=1909290 RepID=UPI003F70F303
MHNASDAIVVPLSRRDPAAAARRVAVIAADLAPERDTDFSVPDTEVAALAGEGLLHAPLPDDLGGIGLGMDVATASMLRHVLRTIGGASLSLGRLYEGHVNAVRLVARYGTPAQMRLLAAEADAGRLSAVWNAQGTDKLRLVDGRLVGGKIYTSGIGIIRRPLLTAETADGTVMLLPDVAMATGDLSGWTVLGMRASMTGRADFTGIAVADGEIIGTPGDYYRSPLFAGGAWRVLAVQLGALEQLMALYRQLLGERGRAGDPVQRARFGEAVAMLETARLWTARAAAVAEDSPRPDGEIDALVNLARYSFDRAALGVIERIQRAGGLSTMVRPNPIERIVRDLTTYLRQPFPDAALDDAARWALAERPVHADLGER